MTKVHRVQWIAWEDDQEPFQQPAYLADDPALARWLQARRLFEATVWEINEHTRKVVAVHVRRGVTRWELPLDGRWIEFDPSDDPRVHAIVDFVEDATIGAIRTLRVSPDEWNPTDPADVTGAYARFGVLPPQLEDAGWAVRYCPEMIADQTAHLTDDQLEHYLSALHHRVMLNVTRNDLDPEERERLINVSLHDLHPDYADIVNSVQMKALD